MVTLTCQADRKRCSHSSWFRLCTRRIPRTNSFGRLKEALQRDATHAIGYHLVRHLTASGLLADLHGHWNRSVEVAVTFPPAPHPAQWLVAGRESKSTFFASGGEPFPILWVKLSVIYPAWHAYYNFWHPRDADPRYCDITYAQAPPSSDWQEAEARISNWLSDRGVDRLSETVLATDLDWLLEEEFDDEDDDEDGASEWLPVHVKAALFGH
jgi:hypothetical protein